MHLFSHTQGKLALGRGAAGLRARQAAEARAIAGAGRGLWGIAAALDDGAEAGAAAASDAGHDGRRRSAAAVAGEPHRHRHHAAASCRTDRDPGKAKAFVDFQNDVTAKDIRLAVREGLRSIEHVKRYTTNGMATDQGKTSNINGLAIAADALGKAPPQVGLTTFRPPYTPITFGTFAGYHQRRDLSTRSRADADRTLGRGARRRLRACRPVAARLVLPAARRGHARRGGARMPRRPRLGRHLRRLDARQDRGRRPRRRRFMDRMYTNPWAKLGVGRCRYGLLLSEDGFICDDGVIGRLADGPLPRHDHHRRRGARAHT